MPLSRDGGFFVPRRLMQIVCDPAGPGIANPLQMQTSCNCELPAIASVCLYLTVCVHYLATLVHYLEVSIHYLASCVHCCAYAAGAVCAVCARRGGAFSFRVAQRSLTGPIRECRNRCIQRSALAGACVILLVLLASYFVHILFFESECRSVTVERARSQISKKFIVRLFFGLGSYAVNESNFVVFHCCSCCICCATHSAPTTTWSVEGV